MAFGSKKRTSGYGEAELLRGLINLASEMQTQPGARRHRARRRHHGDPDLRLPRGGRVPRRSRRRDLPRPRHGRRAPRLRRRDLRPAGARPHLGRALPRALPDGLVLLHRPPAAHVDRGAARTTCRRSRWASVATTSGTRTTTSSCPCTTSAAGSWASSTCTTPPTSPSRRSSRSRRSRCSPPTPRWRSRTRASTRSSRARARSCSGSSASVTSSST